MVVKCWIVLVCLFLEGFFAQCIASSYRVTNHCYILPEFVVSFNLRVLYSFTHVCHTIPYARKNTWQFSIHRLTALAIDDLHVVRKFSCLS